MKDDELLEELLFMGTERPDRGRAMTNAYPAKIKRVIDGDTIDLVIDLGFRISTVQRIRLIDVDTPERGDPDWANATAFTQQWVMLPSPHPSRRPTMSGLTG